MNIKRKAEQPFRNIPRLTSGQTTSIAPRLSLRARNAPSAVGAPPFAPTKYVAFARGPRSSKWM